MESLTESDIPLLRSWLLMCATNAEFVDNYNRLSKASITFRVPDRTAIERLIDAATGHAELPENDDGEMRQFLRFCVDCYTRIPLPF